MKKNIGVLLILCLLMGCGGYMDTKPVVNTGTEHPATETETKLSETIAAQASELMVEHLKADQGEQTGKNEEMQTAKQIYETEVIQTSEQIDESKIAQTTELTDESGAMHQLEVYTINMDSGGGTNEDVKENSQNVKYDETRSWYFNRNKKNLPPTAQSEIALPQYDAYYLGDTKRPVVYLTFDEGYENGYTSQILDVLLNNEVKAAFFVTKPYIKKNPEIIKRMVEEGHIVGNHTASHPNMPNKTNEELIYEIEETANCFKEVTGSEIDRYLRPPEGVYSIRTLELTKSLGYKTCFWSFAYKDWDVDNQPGKDYAVKVAMENYHNGAIILLHAISKSNLEALDEIIKNYKEIGYTFESLNNI